MNASQRASLDSTLDKLDVFAGQAIPTLGPKRQPLPIRFIAKIAIVGNDCWIWLGHRVPAGYGQIRNRGEWRMAHRVAYELFIGPIPEGLVLDHLCRNTSCVNPTHVEPVTPRENTLRGMSPTVLIHHTGRCARGHVVAVDIDDRRQRVRCRTCLSAYQRACKARRTARAAADVAHYLNEGQS